MVKSVVKHGFDCLLSFSEPPEIRTVEGFSAVFAFARCEHRLCSQTTRAPSCATPGFFLFSISVSVEYYAVTKATKVDLPHAARNPLCYITEYSASSIRAIAGYVKAEAEKYPEAAYPHKQATPGQSRMPPVFPLYFSVCSFFLQDETTMPDSTASASTFGMTMRLLNISVNSQTRSFDSTEPRKINTIASSE